MTKDQAKQKFSNRIYEATEVLVELVAEGRLDVPEGATLEEMRRHFADGAAEILDHTWISFDKPAAELSDDELDDIANNEPEV